MTPVAAAAPPAADIRPGRVIVSTAASDAEWDAYVRAHPDGTVDHLWGWRSVIARALGHEGEYLEARRDGALVGVLPLVLVRSRVFGRSVISMPFLNYGGVLADDATVAAALFDAATDIARRFGASHVEFRHRTRIRPDLPCRQHKLAMQRPLPPTSEELWAAVDRKVRNQVRKAQKSGLEVRSGAHELVDEFYGVFARNMRDLGTPVYPRTLFRETLDAFADAARVYVIRHGSTCIAGGVVLRFEDTVVNPWASSLREFRPLCANMLLYWSMLEDAVRGGATSFDFGRSSPGGGTHQFKLQWGAVEQPLCWEYVLLTRREAPDQGPSSGRFDAAIAVWRRLPVGLANVLGPLVARHLP